MSRVLAYGLFSLLIALACAEKVLGTVNMVAVERDWVRVHGFTCGYSITYELLGRRHF